jgi:transcription antitermination factor NusG
MRPLEILMSDIFEVEKLRDGLIKAALQAEELRQRIAELEAAAEETTRRFNALRHFNALRRISEIESGSGVTAEVKLSSIRFVVKEALKPLSLFDWSEASNTEKLKAEQLALAEETPAAAPDADAPVQDEGFTMLNVIVRSINRYTTKHNEVMAVLTTDKGEIVVFPRSWYEYKDAITEAVILGNMLLFATNPDNSKGVTQYILQHIEGVEPAKFPPVADAASVKLKPRFKVGDKVRIKSDAWMGISYKQGEYNVIEMMKNGHIWLEGNEISWHSSDLEAYGESEGE